MAMTVGSITVASNGTWTGSGMALALMNAIQPWMLGQVPAGPAPTDIAVGASNSAKGLALALANALVPYLTTNAQAVAPANAFGSSTPPSEVDLAIK
jgi:hypothetical protein